MRNMTIKKEDKRRIDSFEMKCYRDILNIRWYHRITNEDVINRIQPTIRIWQMVMKRKLGLFGHICRMEDKRLVKTACLGMVEGTRNRGRPRRAWIDDIKEWTGLRIGEIVRIASNRGEWRKCICTTVDTNGQAHGV